MQQLNQWEYLIIVFDMFNNLIRKIITKVFHFHVNYGKNTFIAIQANVDRHTKIGNYSYIAKGAIISNSIIGNYVSIGPGAKIGLGEHDINFPTTSSRIPNKNRNLLKGDCIIGHDVWIGAGAVILRGVSISDGAVIGANAVVTKNVDSYSVVVGVPARHIKLRMDQSKINRIKNTLWWLHEPDHATEILSEFIEQK